MADDWPKIKNRRRNVLSPWMTIVERDVEFTPGQKLETYYSVAQPDYVSILAVTPDGRIPIVRQFRPALEQFTWELPAGLADQGENPEECCRRELLEETGYPALKVENLGTTAACSGRLSNKIHSFFVHAGERVASFQPEAGIDVKLAHRDELIALIRSGEFTSQLHLGAFTQARLAGLLDL